MPDYTITVRMRGDDQLSSVVKGVSNEVQNLGNKSTEAQGKTSGLKDTLGKFKSELGGIATAFGLVKLGQFIGDMNELGMQVTASRNTFTQLSGGASQAAINMDAMRRATRGVVDDMTLMNGANRLLLMGLAGTGEEAAKLAGGAVAMGKAMGMDAAQSVESFAALLANRSIPRLDNFGISAANVRQRIEELKASGVGIEEAFNLAVIAEMEVSMGKLGDTLDANATAFERWGTRIQNTMQDFGSNVAAGFEGFALAAEVLTGQDAGTQHIRGVAQEQATAYADAFIASMQGQLMNTDRGAVEDYLTELFTRQMLGLDTGVGEMLSTQQGAALFPSGVDAAALMGRQQGILQIAASWDVSTAAAAEYETQVNQTAQSMAYLNELNADKSLEGVASGLIEASDAMEAYREETAAAAKATAEAVQYMAELDSSQVIAKPSNLIEASDAMEAYWEQQAKQARAADTLSGVVDGVAFQYNRWTQIGGQAFQTLSGLTETWTASQTQAATSFTKIGNAFSALGFDPAAFSGDMMAFQLPDMPEFVDQTTLDNMTTMYQQAQLELQNIQGLAAQGLIPQTEVTKAQNMVSNLGTMVGQLQTIQQLSDITGQTGGGILGELGNIVMAQAGELDTGLADQLQQQIDLASGKETASSVALTDQAAPLILAIAEQVGPEAAAAALQALEQNMEAGKLAGMADEEIAAMIPQWTGFQMGEGGQVQRAIDMNAMFGSFQEQMAARQENDPMNMFSGLFGGLSPAGAGGAVSPEMTASSPREEMAAMQENLPVIAGLYEPVKTSAAEYAASLTDAKLSLMQSIPAAGELNDMLIAMTSERRRVLIDVVANDPSGILAVMGSQGGTAALEQNVRDNGGQVPGVDARIGE